MIALSPRLSMRGATTLRRVVITLVVAITLPLWRDTARADGPTSRFYFSGDGVLEMRHGHFEERLVVRYRDADGRYDPQALDRIRRFFRARKEAPVGDVSLRLIELIDFVQDRYHPKQTILISGYRSPELNEQLRSGGARAAKSSLHMEGGAADIRFVGVDQRRLWRTLRELGVGGVGLYQKDDFLHLDIGKPRFWEPQTSRVEENISAGNARIFARTDFDRYASLDGAVVQLYAVTELPLRISRLARRGTQFVELEPVDGSWRLEDDCWVIDSVPDSYRLRIRPGAAPMPATGRAPLTLTTCAPRIAATAKIIETNPVEPQR